MAPASASARTSAKNDGALHSNLLLSCVFVASVCAHVCARCACVCVKGGGRGGGGGSEVSESELEGEGRGSGVPQ